MRSIDVPGVGPIQFPDSMSDEQIIQAIERDILPGVRGRTQVAPVQQTEAPAQRAPAPERGFLGSIASAVGDTGASLVTGAGSALSGIGGLGGVAGLGYDNLLSRAGRRVSEFGEGLMSPELVEKRQALSRAIQDAESQGLVGEARAALSTLASNPSLLFSMAIEQIPAFVLSGGAGRGASVVGQVAARRAAVAGGEAAEQAVLRAGQRAGQVGAVGTAAGLQGGSVAEETYQDVMRLPAETLQRSPAYQELIRTMSPAEARATLADRAAREAGVLGGGISVGTMALMPSAEKALFSRGVSQSAIRRALGVGAGEATSEAIEEGGGQFAQNLAIQRRADAERSLTQGVGGAAATGAVLGGIMGAGVGAIQRPPVPPSMEPGAGNLPPELRGAIEDYVANREPVTEGQNLLPREMRDVETPVGNLSRSQLLRYMDRTLPGMIEADPGIASLMAAAGSENERLSIFRDILAERENARIRNLMATSPEAREAFEDVEVQRRTGMRPPASPAVIQRDLAEAERQLESLVSARDEATKRLSRIENADTLDITARDATQAEIAQLDQLIAGRERIRRDLANALPVAEQGGTVSRVGRSLTAQENIAAQSGEAFEIARAREERRRQQQQAQGLEVPTETVITQPIGPGRVGVPELATREIDQPTDDTRAGAPLLTEMRYVLNPQYKKGRLVGGESVTQVLPSDKPGKVLAYVKRKQGAITREVPVETTMSKLAQVPIRETARATQESIGSGFAPPRGVGSDIQPRRAVDRQTPEASARTAGAAQAAPEVEPEASEAETRTSRRVAAQNRLNELYLDKLKGMGAQGRLIRNALVNALKDRTMSAQEVYAAFTAADVVAQILPPTANHRIEFVKELLPTKELAEAIARSGGDPTKPLQGLRQRPKDVGLDGVITLSLAPDMMPYLGETAAHEAFHVLQDYYGKYDAQFKKLMDQGFRDGMMITDVDPTIRRKLEQARYPNSKNSYWDVLSADLTRPLTAREAQAYAFGALVDASRRGVPMSGTKPAFARFVNFVKNFFSKLGSALRGNGFQTVEEVLGRVAREGRGRFADMATPTARDVVSRGPELSARSLADMPGVDVAPGNKLGFEPALRVRADVDEDTLPRLALVSQSTDNKNAARQLAAVDDTLAKFPNPENSPEDWAKMEAYAFSSPEVPVPPYNFMRDINGGAVDLLRTLTAGQIKDADHGFRNARLFRQAYVNKELSPVTTGKLFMWSFLSRGVSPYTQEGLFIDAFDGADQWIRKAAAGDFTEADFPAYERWARSVAPKGSGQPGAGATHNLNAFGKSFLLKMSKRDAPGGISRLQYLHNLMEDPNSTGRGIRREFVKMASDGVGIDNKVVSFTLLVSGFPDVMVLDRVQMRRLWDDGRFGDKNLYDGETEERVVNGEKKRVTKTGTSLAELTYGARGLLIYEAIERALDRRIASIYAAVGRPQDASIGRYHWETWVADSQQEASHGSIDAILSDARGDDRAIARVVAKQGEYGAYEYGARYGRDEQGNPYFIYDAGSGRDMRFSVPAFRGFLTDVKVPASGVVPASVGERPMLDANGEPVLYKVGPKKGQPRTEPIPFSVSESGNAPWYTRPEVNRERLEELASSWADRGGGTGERARTVFADAARAEPARVGGTRSGAEAGLTEEQFEASARATNTTVPEFKNWWNGGWRGEGGPRRESIARNRDGSPQQYYHGTSRSFSVFGGARSGALEDREGPFFLTPKPEFTEGYTGENAFSLQPIFERGEAPRVLPVFVSVQNPFDSTSPKRKAELVGFIRDVARSGRLKFRDILSNNKALYKEEDVAAGLFTQQEAIELAVRQWIDQLNDPQDNWAAIEAPLVQKYIRGNGFDGFYITEFGTKNLAVYDPRQIKSVFNRFEAGAALEPEFSARRTSLASDPAFAALRDKLTGKEYDKPNVFADALRRFTGALPGEKNSSALVRTMVNRAAPGWMLDRLAKEKGLSMRSVGLALEVALNNSGRVQMYLDHGPLAYDPKTGDVTVREDTPGLIAAIKGRLRVEDKKEAQAYLVALRERDLRKAGKKGFFNLTDAEMNSIISKAEAAHPEWKEMAADIQRINKALLDFAVATGTLDRAKADQLANMFYTPFYRQADEDAQKNANEVVGPRLSDSLTRVKTAFDVSLKGGENPLGDLFENMIRNADVIMKAGMKNVAMTQAAEVMSAVGLGRPAKERETGKTITYRVNGQDKHFEVDDPVLYTALAGAPRHVTNGIYQTMATFAGFFRDMITMAPSFMLANLWRGKTMAYVQEGVPFYANTFDGLRQALKSSASYKAIAAQTGFGGYTYGMGERDAAAAFEREIGGLGYGPKGLWHRFTAPLQKASEATEMAERIKLYERAKAQGMTDKEAAFQAYLLAPFSRRGMGGGWAGDTVNFLVPLVPFLNAKIQGMYRLIENEKGDTQKLWTLGIPKQMFLRGLVVMAASLALAAKNMADEPERWDSENPDLKFRYDILYLPGGNRILLPRAFEVGSVFGALPVFIMDAIRREDSRDLSKVLTDIGMSTFFFNPIPQAAIPLIGAATNYDFFRSRALETAGDRTKLPEERFNRSTSEFAKFLGQQTGLSPIRIQYVLEGYSGTIGTSILAGFDSALAAIGAIPGKPAGAFGDPLSMPAIIAGLTGASRFYRSDDQTASRFVGDFYKIKEMTDQLVRSQNMAMETRNLERLAELRGEAGLPLRLRPMVNQASTQINEINARMARIERSDMDSVSKAEALRPLREQRDRVARRVVERARQMGAY